MFSVKVYDHEGELTHDLNAGVAMTQKDGILLTVGRKGRHDINLNDTRASRDHCVVRVISSETQIVSPIELQGQEIAVGQPLAPRNAEETHACAEAPHHTILVLESIGKKGCHVLHEGTTASTSRKQDDDETDAEATDDEEERPSQIPFSQVSKKLAEDYKNPVLKDVPKGDNRVLHELNDTTKKVSIQCAGLSSIVIQRTEWNFLFSKTKVPDLPLSCSHLFGFQVVKAMTPDVTHLVTAQRESVPKQITAWLRGIPMVNPDFLTECLLRSKPTDPLPEPSNFRPKSDKHQFWNTKPNPKLWEGSFFLSLKEDENEAMVAAAGPTLVKLYEAKDDAAILAKAKEMMKKSSHCFTVTDSRRKVVSQLRKLGLAIFSTKAAASSISEQELLRTKDGHVIGTSNEPKEDSQVKQKEDAATEEVAQSKPRDSIEASRAKRKEAPTSTSTELASSEPTKKMKSKKDASVTKALPPRSQDPTETSRAKRKGPPESTTISTGLSSSAPTKKAKHATQPVDPPGPNIGAPNEESKADEKEAVAEQENDTGFGLQDESESEEEPAPKHKKLVSTAGWFAPKSDKEERQSKEPASPDEEDSLDGTAAKATTVLRKGLYIRRDDVSSSKKGGRKSRKQSGKDFKRFRKNVIIPRTTAFVHLKLVSPEITDLQLELKDQNRELEEQRRRADELFRDATVSRGRR